MNPWKSIAQKLANELALIDSDADSLWRFHEMCEADKAEFRSGKYHSDYPTKSMGGGNPYYCCSYCGISDPQINGKLHNHEETCEYRIKKTQELKNEFLMQILNQ
jgi:hypothetical protein